MMRCYSCNYEGDKRDFSAGDCMKECPKCCSTEVAFVSDPEHIDEVADELLRSPWPPR